MKEHQRNVLVGLFVMAALVVLGSIMVMIGEAPSWIRAREWELAINGVSGITEGAPVRLNGVEIGRVMWSEFRDVDRPNLGVRLLVKVREPFRVPQGAYAKAYPAMLGLGAGRVDILVPPDHDGGMLPTEGATIRGEMASFLQDVITEEERRSAVRMVDNIGDVADAWEPAGRDIHQLLMQRSAAAVDQSIQQGQPIMANVSTVVERLDIALRNINEVLGDDEVKGEVKDAFTSLAEAAENLKALTVQWQEQTKRTSDNLNTGIEETKDTLNQTLVKLTEVAGRLDQTVERLYALFDAAARGEGTIGRLFKDPRLYDEMSETFALIAEVAGRLDRILGKVERDGYVTIAQQTAIGTFSKDFPVPGAQGAQAATSGD